MTDLEDRLVEYITCYALPEDHVRQAVELAKEAGLFKEDCSEEALAELILADLRFWE